MNTTTMVKTYFNRPSHPCNYEINDQPSETVPDQTMSIKTILDRYSRGLPIGGQKESYFQEDDEFNDLPDPRRLDLAERQEFAQQAADELSALKKEINSKKYPKKTRPVGDETHRESEANDSLSDKRADGTEAQKKGIENAEH